MTESHETQLGAMLREHGAQAVLSALAVALAQAGDLGAAQALGRIVTERYDDDDDDEDDLWTLEADR